MIEYEKYIERLKRVKAFRFDRSEQASAIAAEFQSASFEFRTSDDNRYELDIAVSHGAETYTQRVNFGDWIIQSPWPELPKVVPGAEFYPAWEREE